MVGTIGVVGASLYIYFGGVSLWVEYFLEKPATESEVFNGWEIFSFFFGDQLQIRNAIQSILLYLINDWYTY